MTTTTNTNTNMDALCDMLDELPGPRLGTIEFAALNYIIGAITHTMDPSTFAGILENTKSYIDMRFPRRERSE
jgi:hypothetical protein